MQAESSKPAAASSSGDDGNDNDSMKDEMDFLASSCPTLTTSMNQQHGHMM